MMLRSSSPRSTLFFVALSLLLLLLLLDPTLAVDGHEKCGDWAAVGECENNPNYMWKTCPEACEAEQAPDTDLASISSFYDLQAYDLDGQLVRFDSFRGKVVVLTNVASFCGYTESHYKGLVELWSALTSSSENSSRVEILAFPCNQFGQQEPKESSVIKQFALHKGVQFRMMQKVDVNGRSAHPVYKYLKQEAGPKAIGWNFATYYVISAQGDRIEAHNNVEPMDLQPIVAGLLEEEQEL